MDYKTYLDFVLALENRKEPQSLQYFFRILDVDHLGLKLIPVHYCNFKTLFPSGYLTGFNLNYFFRDILREMKRHNQDLVQFQDVKDEIFDMVRPRDPHKITLKDIIDSGNGETVVSILIDLNGFWSYENRESLVSEPDN